jgi:glycosyltransferase involved in cell wall biosynthesis
MPKQHTKKIKVLIVINDFLIGGAQKFVVDLLTRLDRTRFEPALMTLFYFGEGDSLYDALPDGVPVYRLNFKSIRDVKAWRDLYRTLRLCGPDVVLSNLFFSNTITRLLALFFHYRVITIEHNTYTEKKRLHQLLDRVLAPLSARIVAVSKTVATFTAAQESIDPTKFIVIRDGVDVKQLQAELAKSDPITVRQGLGFAPEDRIIVNVSRIVPQKNHRLLLDGFALFAADHPHHRLLLVGGGSDEEKIKAYAHKLNLGDSVRFLGYQKDVPQFLGIADFFVSTSLIEGFGIAHAEALACGLPVLTTKTAGPDEMIQEGTNGFFIPEYTKEAVAAGFAQITAQDLMPMRAAAIRSAEAYSTERTVEAYEKLFAETVMDHRTDERARPLRDDTL